MATRKDEMKSAEFSCGRLGLGSGKYIKQNTKEKIIENMKKDVAEGKCVDGHGPQTVLGGARESADDCLAMKNGIRIRSGADGRLAKRKSPKRGKKNKIQKQKRKEHTNEMGLKRLEAHFECKGFRKRTPCWKQSKVTYFSPWSWIFLTGTSGILHLAGTQAGLDLHILF